MTTYVSAANTIVSSHTASLFKGIVSATPASSVTEKETLQSPPK